MPLSRLLLFLSPSYGPCSMCKYRTICSFDRVAMHSGASSHNRNGAGEARHQNRDSTLNYNTSTQCRLHQPWPPTNGLFLVKTTKGRLLKTCTAKALSTRSISGRPIFSTMRFWILGWGNTRYIVCSPLVRWLIR